jgi:FkbM family methyltransferase
MVRGGAQAVALFAYRVLVASGAARVPIIQKVLRIAYKFYKTHLETGPINSLQQFVTPGSLAIDVGANIGYFTLKFSEWVGPSGRVIAIEPDEDNVSGLIQELAAAKRDPNVQVHKAVAADKAGSVRLRRNEVHPGDHKISTSGDGIEISALTIDDVAKQYAGLPVSLIKIDVQGAELLVLRGATEVMRRHRPVFFVELLESALQEFGASVANVIELMRREGYVMQTLGDDGAVSPLTEGDLADLRDENEYVDVLFRPAMQA